MVILGVAFIIDIMKPASLGFVTPGMRVEYGIDSATVAVLPFSALIGTATGSFVWGALALVPALGAAAAVVALPAMMSLVPIAVCGRETRGRAGTCANLNLGRLFRPSGVTRI
jgi:putative MFS transporter